LAAEILLLLILIDDDPAWFLRASFQMVILSISFVSQKKKMDYNLAPVGFTFSK
jgi:hypothetical protein